MKSWIEQLHWPRLKPMEKLARMLLDHLEGILNYCRTKVRLGVVEAVNRNIKARLRRRRGYRDLNCLLLKAQRLAATKTQFIVLQKAAKCGPRQILVQKPHSNGPIESSARIDSLGR